MDNLQTYLYISAILFSLGLYGVITRRNGIAVLMGIELILNSANINFVAFARFGGMNFSGQIFSLFVLTVAAAEAAIGLAILVCFFRNKGSIAVDDANVMKG